jgi:hypothetical protein
LAKAITQYPIFILVLVSLIVLSTIATYILQEISTGSRQESNIYPNTDRINYIYINNTLYIKTKKHYEELIEIIILKNNTIVKHILPSHNNTLYGPLITYSNTTKIILLCKDSDHYKLLDIIAYEEQLTNISMSKSYKEKYPPAIIINPLLRINTLENINGINKFYILRPYILIKNITLKKYHIYNIAYDKVLDKNAIPGKIRVYAGELNESKTLGTIFNEYLQKYGNITQYRFYLLNIYKDKEYQYKLPETYIFNVSEKNNIVVESSDKIADIMINQNYSLLETLLEHRIFRIYVRDSLGKTYVGKAIIEYRLVLNGVSNKKYIYLIKTVNTYTNITDEIIKLNTKKIIRDSGRYSVYLNVNYNITVPQPINPPLYVTIVYSLSGSGSSDQAIITYLTDKILINTPNENIIQVPLMNNTLTTISIHKELLSKNYSLNINNTYLLNTETYNITYNSIIVKPVKTIIYIHPSITVSIANYIQIINYDRECLKYFINKSNIYYTIGFYTEKDTLTLILKYYPVIINNTSQLIINNTSTFLYSIVNDSFIRIYSEKYNIIQDSNLTLYGFYVLSKYIYQEPILVINYTLLLRSVLSVKIIITYIDNSSQAINLSNNVLAYGISAYRLQNKPVSNINMYIKLKKYNCILAYSMRLASPIALINITNNSFIQIMNYYIQSVNDLEYYIVLFCDGTVIYSVKY